MRECIRCKSQMEEGFCLKVNTYGRTEIEKNSKNSVLPFTKPKIEVAVCPNCGEVSFYVQR